LSGSRYTANDVVAVSKVNIRELKALIKRVQASDIYTL